MRNEEEQLKKDIYEIKTKYDKMTKDEQGKLLMDYLINVLDIKEQYKKYENLISFDAFFRVCINLCLDNISQIKNPRVLFALGLLSLHVEG